MHLPPDQDLPIWPEVVIPTAEDAASDSEEESLMSHLEEVFKLLHPIHARRRAYFDAKQQSGQTMTLFMANLGTLAQAAMLHEINYNQLQVYRIISGCTDSVLKTKILEKEEEPTIASIKAVVTAYEASKNVRNYNNASPQANFSRKSSRPAIGTSTSMRTRGRSRARSTSR